MKRKILIMLYKDVTYNRLCVVWNQKMETNAFFENSHFGETTISNIPQKDDKQEEVELGCNSENNVDVGVISTYRTMSQVQKLKIKILILKIIDPILKILVAYYSYVSEEFYLPDLNNSYFKKRRRVSGSS